jgi:hypothetical protein
MFHSIRAAGQRPSPHEGLLKASTYFQAKLADSWVERGSDCLRTARPYLEARIYFPTGSDWSITNSANLRTSALEGKGNRPVMASLAIPWTMVQASSAI